MKIALFHATLPEPGRKPGGVEVAVHRLANALAATGEDRVTVYSLTPCPADARYSHRKLFRSLPWLRTNQFGRLLVLPALLNLVSFDGDVVHLNGDDWFYIRRPHPTLRTLHGSALREAQSATSWKRKLLQYGIYPLERLSALLCRVTLAVGLDAVKIYHGKVVDNGVDVDVFHPGPKLAQPRVLFVGSWLGRKRGRYIFDVFTRLVLPQFPNAKLCMVSDYCPEHPGVIAETFPPDEVLAARYRESWVFAYPSTYEGFGIAYLEALASGTAIVSSPNDGAHYILAGGKYGEIAADEDFGARLIELLSSSERRDELARKGRARAAEFSWHAVAARHRQLYREALAG